MARDDKGFLLLNERELPSNEYPIAQIKHDGRRVQVEKKGDSVMLRGRDNIVPNNYPEVIEAFRKIPHDFKLDTEFVVLTDEWKSDRGLLQARDKVKDPFKIKMGSKLHPVTAMAFDLLELDGMPLTNKPYKERKELLDTEFKDNFSTNFRAVKDWSDPFEAWQFAQDNLLEGIVQRKNVPYIPKRTDDAIKVKRKGLFPMLFSNYEISNAGITLVNDNTRVACHGHQHIEVKDQIDKRGWVRVVVRGMADKTDRGKIREPVFYKLLDEGGK